MSKDELEFLLFLAWPKGHTTREVSPRAFEVILTDATQSDIEDVDGILSDIVPHEMEVWLISSRGSGSRSISDLSQSIQGGGGEGEKPE